MKLEGCAYGHDVIRGYNGGAGFGMHELQCGYINRENQLRTPPPGMIRLWTYQAIAQGAEEIDIVLPIGKFLMDDLEYIEYEIQAIRERIGPVLLKVILETGSLNDLTLIRKASLLAITSGADFIKTSTGKISPGATPEAMVVMCHAIRDYYNSTGRKIGIKPAAVD